MQQCLYRTVNPVTAFKVLDPDPNAVDDGHVLGLRFEVMSRLLAGYKKSFCVCMVYTLIQEGEAESIDQV